MTKFPPRAVQTINDFVQNMQMDKVHPAADGSYSFMFKHAGLLSISPSEDGTRAVIALKAHDQHPQTADDLIQFLAIAQRDPITRAPISAGMVGGQRVLAANLKVDTFNLQQIELCLDRLIALHQSAA